MKNRIAAAAVASMLLAGAVTAAPSDTDNTPGQKPLSAQASNPRTMGWMQGFPPPKDKIIRFTDPNYFAFPKLRWTVCHFRQLMPTLSVRTGSSGASKLPVALDPHIDAVTLPRWAAARR